MICKLTTCVSNLLDEDGEIKKMRLRAHDVFVLPRGQKILLDWNDFGQPIKESGGLLGQFLRHVAADFTNFPISYEKWPRIPRENKEYVWTNIIQVQIVVNTNYDILKVITLQSKIHLSFV